VRFIVAARLSRKPRPGEDIEFPIDAQDKRAREWGEAQHDGPNGEPWKHVATAADYKRGTVPPWNRPNLRKFVTDHGSMAEYDAIVAIKTDRISRGTDEDFSQIEAWASTHGKKLIIVGPDGGIQYPARHDSDFWQWTATKRQSRKEWEDIRDRSMNRQADLIARKRLVGRPSFGYQVVGTKYDKTLAPTDVGRKYVPEIFQRVAVGHTLLSVAKWLDSEGVKPNSREGVKWSPQSISQIIRSWVYLGQRRACPIVDGKVQRGKGETLLEFDPVVDEDLWLKANQRLDIATRGGKRGPVNGEKPLLSGALQCGNCDSPMYKIKPRRYAVSYRCHGKMPQPKGCGTMVPMELLDSIVDESMRSDHRVMLKTEFVPGENHDAEIAKIRLKLRDLPTRNLSEDEEDAERARLRTEKRRLESLPTTAPDWKPVIVTDDQGNPVTYAAKWDSSDLAGKREMLKEMRITFRWDEIDGRRFPLVGIVPLWAENT
jgi:hypothetical protein